MNVRNNTEAFLNALKSPYFNNTANVSTDYLRGECRLLSFLSMNPDKKYKSGELSKLLNVTTARMATTLNSLEKKNMIARNVSESDKRKVYVTITEIGTEYIEKKREDVCLFFDEIFGKLTQDECDQFIGILNKICEIGEEIFDKK
jgi:DNA-binding MarR family transcriptional regulator